MARATTEDMASMTAADRESARTDRPIDPRSTSHSRIRGLAFLIAALAPALAAIWAVPWFVTQDAPAHVYNAEILRGRSTRRRRSVRSSRSDGSRSPTGWVTSCWRAWAGCSPPGLPIGS